MKDFKMVDKFAECVYNIKDEKQTKNVERA